MVQLPQENIPASQEVVGTVTLTGVTEKRLYGPDVPVAVGSPPVSPALDDLLYTCPAATRAVVKQIILCNTLASPSAPERFSLSIGPLGVGGAILWEHEVAAEQTEILDVTIPLTAGETLHGVQEGIGLTVTITGTEQAA